RQVPLVGDHDQDGEDQPGRREEHRYPGHPPQWDAPVADRPLGRRALLLHHADATDPARGVKFPSYPCPNLSGMTEAVAVAVAAEAEAEAVPEIDASARPSLSPSRAADFKTCPLLYRFRTIDRLPEQPSPDQARGTLVHAVLERLFDLPAADRTVEQAAALVEEQWQRLLEQQEELTGLFAEGEPPEEFLT